MRKQRVGGAALRGGFQTKVQGLRSPDYDSPQASGEKCEGNTIKRKGAWNSYKPCAFCGI